MKIGIIPVWMGVAVLSLGLGLSLSENFNPGYGVFNNWWPQIWISAFTASLTVQHALAEAKRLVNGAHCKRVLIRGLILAGIALLPYREVSLLSVNLFLNQAFLFGALFDPIRNLAKGDSFFYHGSESIYDRIVNKSPRLVFSIEVVAFIATSVIMWIS